MTNPFASTAANPEEKIAGEDDRLGGFQVLESDLYTATIKNAYAGKADSGANSMTYDVELEGGQKFSWTEWVTSGTAKGCLPYWTNDKGEKNYLPGYNRAKAIALMTAGKELDQLKFEEKLVKIYSSAAKAEVPTPVLVATELLGQKVILGIQKVKSNKQVKTDAGYADTNDVRFTNEVDKVFHFETRRTLKEAFAKVEKGEFIDKWLEANKGKERDKFKAVTGAPAAGAPGQTGGNDKPTTSLFS